MATLVFLSLLLAGASAQIITSGRCPNVTVQQNFDRDSYLGRWYEQEKYFTFFEQRGVCVSATYSLNPNETIGVRNYLFNTDTNEPVEIFGYAKIDSDSGEGKLLVSFPSSGSYDGKYWILETDYTRYSVVWSCDEVGSENLQFAWVLTRERFPNNETLDEIARVIAANQLQEEFLTTPQDNCPPDP